MKRDEILYQIMESLERLTPKPPNPPNFKKNHTFIWKDLPYRLEAINNVRALSVDCLVGIDDVKSILLENTRQFSAGYSANNALLWGARGMGKSSLVKSVHSLFTATGLKLIEIRREDLSSLERLIGQIENLKYRFILFCDDLSFGTDDPEYKSLKVLLDGGLQSKPRNVIFYATSNRRHLMPREMIENEKSSAIYPSESVEEKISLSDRFGLWLGFYKCTQHDYFKMITSYAEMAGIKIDHDTLCNEALIWQQTRGSRSGRVAWQFITDLAGRNNIDLSKIL